MQFAMMTAQGAHRRGFPPRPQPGQKVFSDGVFWVWYPLDEPQEGLSGLGDLGFWGAFVSAVAGPIMGLFGGGKGDKEARQAIEQQQSEIDRLKEELAAKPDSIWNKKTLTIAGLVIIGAMALKR